ncbi:MAG: sulfatase-like hydrolase/transferase [Deltaproteobacteria bacterium]|nr:sulfatase-like hydrolase/transferase [Deltaproteobacteria bacterium]MBN2673184.1 sulfatase-like hydrolase/transferase [Deltaproteobacteria bacterium]
MWRTTKLWQITFSAAVSALFIGIADCFLAGCGLGTIIIALRLSAAGMLVSLCAYLCGSRLHLKTKLPVQLLVAVTVTAPLAVFAGIHLSNTPTILRLLGYHYRVALPTAAFILLFGTLFWLLTSTRKWLQGLPTAIVSVLLASVLFATAVYCKKLHYPLAVPATFFCWLALQRPLQRLIRHGLPQIHMTGALLCLSSGILMTLWPVSLEDTFAASDQGIVARDIAYWGKAHTIDELVQQVHPNTVISTPQPRTEDLMLPHVPGQSVVLISVDALRPDHLGINGYKRRVSPNLDRLLKNAVRFNNAYATAPTSSFSIPAIHTGMPMEERLKSGVALPPLLASHFNDIGYKTVGLFPIKVFSVGPELMGALQKSEFGFSHSRLLEMDARKDVDIALSYLKQPLGDQPLFMWVHFYDPHLPYSCHDKPFGETQADCYDAEIAYLDEQIQRFIDGIYETLNSPVIAFTADHAEAFGEHGRYYHSTDLYDEQVKVPLAFIVPGVAAKTVDVPVSNCFIFDTLLSLTQPNDRALSNDLRPHMVSDIPGSPILSAINDKRAVVFNYHKLICEDWPTGACALFDLRNDPHEKQNLAAKNIPQTMDLLSMLKTASQRQLHQLQQDTPTAIVLGRLKRPGATQGLAAIAKTPSSEYAIEAARLLAFLKNEDASDFLSELEQSPNKKVAAWAAIGNGLLHNDFDTTHLLPFFKEQSRLGHWSAILLGRNGDDRALKPLLALLKNDEPFLRAQAALSLGELGNRRAVTELIALLEVKQSRWAAIEALGELEDRRALHILTRLKRNEPDVSNLPRYERAIERIENN